LISSNNNNKNKNKNKKEKDKRLVDKILIFNPHNVPKMKDIHTSRKEDNLRAFVCD